jgi:UDP-N-acetylglucosamine:LPS N-acetylglucosamine transferase
MDMLAELAIANAAFQVIKQTLSNGKEIADAGSALTKYFSASQSIQQKAKMGTGDVLAAYQAKQAIERQEKELEFMLNKQGLLGYYKYQQFRDEFFKKQKTEAARQRVRNKKIKSNVETGFLVTLLTMLFLAAFVGVLIYIKGTL